MKTVVETIILVLGFVMVTPLPYEAVIGGYGRLALAVLGFLFVFWWLFRNDHNKDLRDASAAAKRQDSRISGVRQRALEPFPVEWN